MPKKTQPKKQPAAPEKPPEPRKRDWLRLVVMVENTEPNRNSVSRLVEGGKGLAGSFEGKKIVKLEVLNIATLVTSKPLAPS